LIVDIRQIIRFMRMTGVRLRFFVQSLLLSFGLTLFNMYTVALLFPLVQGIIKGDFGHVRHLHFIGWVVGHFPRTFSNSFSLFIVLLCWIYATIIIKNMLHYGAFLSTQYQAKTATVKLRNILLDRCMSYGKSFYDKNKVLYIHGVVTKSTNIIESQFKLFQSLIIESFLLIMYFSIMLKISWKLALISLVCFPAFDLLTRTMIKKIRSAVLQADQATMSLSARVYNILSCVLLIKGFAKEEQEKAYFLKASEEEIDRSYKTQKMVNLIGPLQDISMTTSIVIIALGMAFIIHFDHSLDATGAFVFFYLAQRIIPGLNTINNFKIGMVQAGKDVEDINKILQGSDHFIVKSGSQKFMGIEKSIEFRNLSFRYLETGNFVLQSVNMVIPKGRMTAIVGPTGSGKSTIANLLLRFYECPPGSIFLDDVDIHQYNVESLRERMSFVEQGILLFNDTVRYNIAYGNRGEVSDEVFNAVSLKTGVDDFIQKLPNKYETVIGEKGANLSGGEKQRISIARALLKDYDILIMDEPTSALDARTEQKIAQALAELSLGKTLVVISHRLSTIKNADHIIYIEKGRILESGSLKDLLDKKGLFFKQWEAQKI